MNREDWCAAVQGVAKSWTRLSDRTELNSVPFRYLFIYFLTYFVSGLLFPGFEGEFFFPFGFLHPKVGSVVCVSFL